MRFDLHPLPGNVHVLSVVEAILKHPGRILHEISSNRHTAVMACLSIIAIVCLAIYGAVAGSLSGGTQLLIAPTKIIIGSALCVIICLPSLYILLCLGGADASLRQIAGELFSAVSLTALLLISFAPIIWIFSQSTDSVALIGLLHLVFWAVAAWFGLRLIGKSSARGKPGGLRNTGLWISIYLVVCLQMMTALRPIVGKADTFLPREKKFFAAHFIDMLQGKPAPAAKPIP